MFLQRMVVTREPLGLEAWFRLLRLEQREDPAPSIASGLRDRGDSGVVYRPPTYSRFGQKIHDLVTRNQKGESQAPVCIFPMGLATNDSRTCRCLGVRQSLRQGSGERRQQRTCRLTLCPHQHSPT
ncbi:hypothetical protein VUR80DRAFT_9136 [Thermomyces stellatus]